jgi:hypothetical protein
MGDENDWVYLGDTKVNVRSAGGPTSITFLVENGEIALKINSDGTIETGVGIKPTDAAARVIEAVKQMWGNAFDRAITDAKKPYMDFVELYLKMYARTLKNPTPSEEAFVIRSAQALCGGMSKSLAELVLEDNQQPVSERGGRGIVGRD